jgi:hypothetical protein
MHGMVAAVMAGDLHRRMVPLHRLPVAAQGHACSGALERQPQGQETDEKGAQEGTHGAFILDPAIFLMQSKFSRLGAAEKIHDISPRRTYDMTNV